MKLHSTRINWDGFTSGLTWERIVRTIVLEYDTIYCMRMKLCGIIFVLYCV